MAHLFTYAPFPSGVLGLAYIGSPRQFSVGGICSPRKMDCSHTYVCVCMRGVLISTYGIIIFRSCFYLFVCVFVAIVV